MTTLRAEILLCRALLLAVIIACAFIGGCGGEMAQYGSMTLGDTALMASGGRAATTSEAVFEVPEANALATAYGRANLPEYSRLDGAMNIYNPSLRLATNQWPQEPALDAERVRYVYLPINTSGSSMTIPVYRRERPYWR